MSDLNQYADDAAQKRESVHRAAAAFGGDAIVGRRRVSSFINPEVNTMINWLKQSRAAGKKAISFACKSSGEGILTANRLGRGDQN